MASPVAVVTCLLAVSATCLLSQLQHSLQRRSSRGASQRPHAPGPRRAVRSATGDAFRASLEQPDLGERAACPFSTETVTLGELTLTSSTCVSEGGPCAGGVPFTVCQQLTQTVLVDGRSVELNTACLCALRAPAEQEHEDRRRRRRQTEQEQEQEQQEEQKQQKEQEDKVRQQTNYHSETDVDTTEGS